VNWLIWSPNFTSDSAYAVTRNILVLWPFLTPVGGCFATTKAGDTTLPMVAILGLADVFGLSYVLASVAGILVGVAMLRSAALPALAGWVAIVANLLGA